MSNVTSTDALPAPDKSARLSQSLDLFGATTVSSALYTIVLMFYCLSFHHFYRRVRRDRHYRRVALFSLVHASLVTLWSTIFLALTTWSMQVVYLDHGTYPGGPYKYENDIFSRQAISPLTSTSSFMIGILTLGIQIWRVWVIWSSARYRFFIIATPVILFLTFIGLGTLSILGWSKPNVLTSELNTAVSAAVYGVGAATTIAVTTLAVARLLLVRRYHIELMGKSDISNQYVNIVAIITESYALESIWSLITMILYAVDNPVSIIFIQCENFIRVIAYFLVIYRISTGRAWSGKTGNELSTLQWNHTVDSAQSETFI